MQRAAGCGDSLQRLCGRDGNGPGVESRAGRGRRAIGGEVNLRAGSQIGDGHRLHRGVDPCDRREDGCGGRSHDGVSSRGHGGWRKSADHGNGLNGLCRPDCYCAGVLCGGGGRNSSIGGVVNGCAGRRVSERNLLRGSIGTSRGRKDGRGNRQNLDQNLRGVNMSAAAGGDGERINSSSCGGGDLDREHISGGRAEGQRGRGWSHRDGGGRAGGERDGSAKTVDGRKRERADTRPGRGDLHLGALRGEGEIRLSDRDVHRIGRGRVVVGVALVEGGENIDSIGGGVAGNGDGGRAAAEIDKRVEALAVGEEGYSAGGGWLAHGSGDGGRENKGLAGCGVGGTRSEQYGGGELAGEGDDGSTVSGTAQPVGVAGVVRHEGQNARRNVGEGDHRLEAGVAGCAKWLPGSAD